MINYNFLIKPDINEGELIKYKIIEKLNINNTHLLHQIEMTFSELIENAIKYSDKNINNNIEVLFEYNGFIKITVSNYIEEEQNIKNLIQIIEKIKHINKKDNLYFKRIQEIIEREKHGESQMGLYRIFYEGEFDLDYKIEYSINKITIIATKNY